MVLAAHMSDTHTRTRSQQCLARSTQLTGDPVPQVCPLLVLPLHHRVHRRRPHPSVRSPPNQRHHLRGAGGRARPPVEPPPTVRSPQKTKQNHTCSPRAAPSTLLRPCASAQQVTAAQLAAFDKREEGYRRIAVPLALIEVLSPHDPGAPGGVKMRLLPRSRCCARAPAPAASAQLGSPLRPPTAEVARRSAALAEAMGLAAAGAGGALPVDRRARHPTPPGGTGCRCP